MALLALSSLVTAGQATSYDRFYNAFGKNDLTTIRSIRNGSDSMSTDAWLRGIAGATVHLRAAELPECLGLLDSLRRVTAISDHLAQGWISKLQAVALDRIGSNALALEAIKISLSFHTRELHPKEYTEQLIVRSEIYRGLNEHALALRDIREASLVADSIGHNRAHCMIELGLGNICYEREEYQNARSHFEKCFQLAHKDGYQLLAKNALNNLGNASIMTGDIELARRCYTKVLNEHSTSDPLERSDLLDQLGYVLRETGAINEALGLFERSLLLKDSIHDSKGSCRVLLHMGTALWLAHKKMEAIETLEHAVHLARAESVGQVELEGLSSLAYYRSLLGQFELAYADKNAEMWLNDSLVRSRYSEQASMNRILFETERKEHKIATQDQALKFAAIESRQKVLQRNVLVASTILTLIIALLLYRSLRSKQRLAKKEKELHHQQIDQLLSQQEMKSINAMLEGQEQERARVSKELHDHVGHLLGTIKHQLGQLEEQVADVRSEQTAQYRKVTGLLDNAAGALRRISHDMAAATLNRFGLEKALKDLRDTIHINGRLQVELNTYGLEHPLERGVEIAVYRIIQEAVSNVLKHAQANEMSIAVTHAPGRMSVLVSDNGQGFDTNQTSHGVGLANIRSRAAALGAQVQIDSAPGKGTTISVECPVME
ncbi:MAG: sensor histidine kinase [Flavobacteriales bacterium]|nr:sensor histidine kinase [Flavobacteriales bacterium]